MQIKIKISTQSTVDNVFVCTYNEQVEYYNLKD